MRRAFLSGRRHGPGRRRRAHRLSRVAVALPGRPARGRSAPRHVAAAPSETATQLPIGQVVLFSSGVGYFQREGTVEGNARVDLSLPRRRTSTTCSSRMVLRDLDGGHISAVSYDTNAPVEKTLQSLRHQPDRQPDLRPDPQPGARREGRGRLAAGQRGPARHDDRHHRRHRDRSRSASARTPSTSSMLNLWCADGMRSVKLTDVQRVRFLNPIMDSEFKQGAGDAGAVARHAEEGGQHQLRGRRQARGARRLRDREPHLEDQLSAGAGQGEGGQAVPARLGHRREPHRRGLEGRPHGPGLRPADLLPDGPVSAALCAAADGRAGTVRLAPARHLQRRPGQDASGERLAAPAPEADGNGAKRLPTARRSAQGGRAWPRDKPATDSSARDREATWTRTMDLGQSGVSTMATAAKLGDFFQYAIDKPVTPAAAEVGHAAHRQQGRRGQRASASTTSAPRPSSRCWASSSRTPRGLHLMQGPITVFEGSNYAGDARILDLQPNEERLLSYAIDLGTEVNPVPSSDNGRLTTVKVVKGIIYSHDQDPRDQDLHHQEPQRRRAAGAGRASVRNDFKLIDDTDKPAETASDVYRFEVKVAGRQDRRRRPSPRSASSTSRSS